MKINSLGPTLLAESLCNEVFYSNLFKDDGDRNEYVPACMYACRGGEETHTKANNYKIKC